MLNIFAGPRNLNRRILVDGEALGIDHLIGALGDGHRRGVGFVDRLRAGEVATHGAILGDTLRASVDGYGRNKADSFAANHIGGAVNVSSEIGEGISHLGKLRLR